LTQWAEVEGEVIIKNLSTIVKDEFWALALNLHQIKGMLYLKDAKTDLPTQKAQAPKETRFFSKGKNQRRAAGFKET